jgi:hypothetical protein
MRKVFFLFILIAGLSSSSFAAVDLSSDEEIPAGPSHFDLYWEKLDQKFDKGAVNFVAGWTEIFRQPVLELKDANKKNAAFKFFKGFGEGLYNGVADTLGGFFNTVTSVFPQFEIPLPDGGVQAKTITGGEPAGFVEVPLEKKEGSVS